VLARAAAAVHRVARELGGEPMLFVGAEDEGHDTEPTARAAEAARAAALCDRFNREQEPELLRPLLA
jgi:hypothetical protein